MALLQPPARFWSAWGPALPDFSARVFELQRRTDWRPTSWYRDPWHNASVGGAACSQHTHGLAADGQNGRSSSATVFAVARSLGLIPVAVAGSPTATHVQYLNPGTLLRHGLCFGSPRA